MELIRYWRIVYRHGWVIVGLLVLVALVSAVTHDWSPPAVFSTTFRFNVGLEPMPPTGAEYVYNPHEIWMASEYLMDDLASAVRGSDYAQRVAARLDEEEINLAGRFAAATEHRVLTVSATWGDRAQLERIANAAVTVLNEEAGQLVGPLGEARPVLRLIEPPAVVPVGRSLKDRLDTPIRLGLALVAGIAGAFLLEYLDGSVQTSAEVEEMGISVLGQIPRRK